jgi:hypothetical protein
MELPNSALNNAVFDDGRNLDRPPLPVLALVERTNPCDTIAQNGLKAVVVLLVRDYGIRRVAHFSNALSEYRLKALK